MMHDTIHLEIIPTVFIKDNGGVLHQIIRVSITNDNVECRDASLLIECDGQKVYQGNIVINIEDSIHEIGIPEVTGQVPVKALISVDNQVVAKTGMTLSPPRHWEVHVVQLSHHDLGYTGLPSNVLSKYARYLDQAIDMAESTQLNPDDSLFRIVLEQAWSVDYFLKNAPAERAQKMIKLMQSGQFELTALFGNMITELCSHESLINTLYPSVRLKRKYGIPVVSAEHNDIPGMSWGLCRLLTDAGIQIFCPGIPKYYRWADPPFQSFWDQKAVFGYDDAPGAFWWEAASGKRVLFWCNNSGCGGTADPELPGLEAALLNLESKAYPSSVLRWPVQGGARDNSPYIIGFVETIKKWNETWAYPKLISSTNAKFYSEFSKSDLSHLPVHRGELPGQDYPVGASSTAKPTACNRRNSHAIAAAEKLAVVAKWTTDYEHQAYELEKAKYSTLCFEEHAFGHTFSHGPAMDGAEAEKGVHAYRASAYAHDVRQKALAKIADHIQKTDDAVHLVVFNPLGFERTNVIRVPMREIENSEIIMEEINGILTAAALPGRKERTHLILPEDFITGQFELCDAVSGQKIECQLLKISADNSDAAHAAQRSGLSQGRKSYFNHCNGWDYDLCFVANDIPAMGYKTYSLKPISNKAGDVQQLGQDSQSVENEYYRITIDSSQGRIVSIYDKEQQRELIDKNAPHYFGEIIVRSPSGDTVGTMRVCGKPEVQEGKICTSITLRSTRYAHPVISQTISLYPGVKKIDFTAKILKESIPLLDVHIAFPFAMSDPCFSYEGTLNVLEPVRDCFPEAYSDVLAIQNWVKVSNSDHSLIWSSHDAPVVGLSELWPGYVSPAHRCVLPQRMRHAPQTRADYKNGWIYSNIFDNNYCTNFSVAQNGEFCFRYSLTTAAAVVSVPQTIRTGMDLSTPFDYIFSAGAARGELPLQTHSINIAHSDIILLYCKHADEGEGVVMRFWNPTDSPITSRIDSTLFEIVSVHQVNPAEEKTEISFEADKGGFQITIDPQEILSVMVQGEKNGSYSR